MWQRVFISDIHDTSYLFYKYQILVCLIITFIYRYKKIRKFVFTSLGLSYLPNSLYPTCLTHWAIFFWQQFSHAHIFKHMLSINICTQLICIWVTRSARLLLLLFFLSLSSAARLTSLYIYNKHILYTSPREGARGKPKSSDSSKWHSRGPRTTCKHF